MDFYPNSALVAPIIPANQQLQTAAQTAALQQRSALEAQQTQAAALSNEQTQIIMQEQKAIQDAYQKALSDEQTTQQPNNAASGIPANGPSTATPQSTIPATNAPATDQSSLVPGAIGLTATGAPVNQAALVPQIPPMLARVAPNQGAAPSLGQQVSAPMQAATTQQAPLYTWSPNGKAPDGQATPGNIDLTKITPTQNIQDPSKWSTVNSTSFQDENPKSPTYGKEVLVRGYLNGQTVDPTAPGVMDQLKAQYYKTGQNLGVFNNGDTADVYAQQLHSDWEAGKIPGVQMQSGSPTTNNSAAIPPKTQAPSSLTSQTGPVPTTKGAFLGDTMQKALTNMALSGQVRPSTLFALQKEALERKKEYQSLTEQQQTIRDKTNESVVQIGNQFLGLPYDQQADAFPTYRSRLISAGMDPSDLPQNSLQAAGGVPGIRNFVIHHMTEQHMDEYAKGLDDLKQKGLVTFSNAASQVNNDTDYQKLLNDPNTYTPALWGSGLVPNHYSPQGVAALAQSTIPPKDQPQYAEDVKKQTAQDISGMNQAQLDAYNIAHPGIPGLPRTVADIPSYTRGVVAIKEQPEYDIQTRTADQMSKMTPQDWDNQINIASGGDQALAARTKALVGGNVARGDWKSAQTDIKDASDQVGRIQVAKEEAKNRVTINGIGTGPNGEPSATAQMVADYQIPFSQAASRLPAKDRDILNTQVRKLNPQFQASNFNTFQSTERAFTSGEPANKIRALNTMMGHLSTLDQAATLLDNGNLPALNKLANFVSVQSGKDPVTTFNAIVHRIGPEVTNAYIASGGTSAERGTNEQDFNANLGAKQIKSNIGVAAQLAGSLVNGLQDQYQRGTYGRGTQKLLTDEADGARQRLTAQSPVRTNTVTMDQVNAYAKKHNITPAASRLKAESEGFTVK